MWLQFSWSSRQQSQPQLRGHPVSAPVSPQSHFQGWGFSTMGAPAAPGTVSAEVC